MELGLFGSTSRRAWTLSPKRVSRNKSLPGSGGPGQLCDQPLTAERIAALEQDLCHPKGHMKTCLLLLLVAKPAHGYELVDSLKDLGYQGDDRGPVYRALRWLEESGLLQPSWDSSGSGPARRVFAVTPAGSRIAAACAASLKQRTEVLQDQLSLVLHERSDERARRFVVLVEFTVRVVANDAESARRALECALGRNRRLTADISLTGQLWVSGAAEGKIQTEEMDRR